jgi:hypothetical protein
VRSHAGRHYRTFQRKVIFAKQAGGTSFGLLHISFIDEGKLSPSQVEVLKLVSFSTSFATASSLSLVIGDVGDKSELGASARLVLGESETSDALEYSTNTGPFVSCKAASRASAVVTCGSRTPTANAE